MILTLLILIALCFLIFGLFPQIDLGFSRLIHGKMGWLGSEGWLKWVREIYFEGSFIILYVFIILWLLAIFRPRRVPARRYGFFVSLAFLGPIGFVNLLLKSHWGRARPIQITEFGGEKSFTPAQIFPVDQCAYDCSFVSGEAAAAAAMIFTFLLMFGYSKLAKITIWALIAPMAILRIFFGMHFLSDVIFAFLFIWLIGLLLLRIFGLKNEELITPLQDIYLDIKDAFRAFGKWGNRRGG